MISDTHGLRRPQALEALGGSDRIVHAGDVGDPAVLDALASMAPVTAVRGNIDRGGWAGRLPEAVTLVVGGVRLHVVHDLATLDPAVDLSKVHVVIFGHSHIPSVERAGDTWFFNPGSAGPRRFRLPVSVGELIVTDGRGTPRLRELSVGQPRG